MKRILIAALCPLLIVSLMSAAQAAPILSSRGNAAVKAADLPDLSTLPEHSPQTGYLSLTGYLNWWIYEHSGTWLTLSDRRAALEDQIEANHDALSSSSGVADR